MASKDSKMIRVLKCPFSTPRSKPSSSASSREPSDTRIMDFTVIDVMSPPKAGLLYSTTRAAFIRIVKPRDEDPEQVKGTLLLDKGQIASLPSLTSPINHSPHLSRIRR